MQGGTSSVLLHALPAASSRGNQLIGDDEEEEEGDAGDVGPRKIQISDCGSFSCTGAAAVAAWVSLGCAGGSLWGLSVGPLLPWAPPAPPEGAELLLLGHPTLCRRSLVASALLETKKTHISCLERE